MSQIASGRGSVAIARASFGRTPQGDGVDVVTLRAGELTMRVITYGGIIVSFEMPDRHGSPGDIVLGYDTLDGYLTQSSYFGAIIGRCANRIADGRFSLGGTTYQLARNDGAQHLHGGRRGFDKAIWGADPFTRPAEAGVVLTYVSPDGEENYPGTLHTEVRYTLRAHGELAIEYQASTTDHPTIVNLTQHSYWNLAGEGDVLSHRLRIDAGRYTPVDARLIPTGELGDVDATPFDFRTPRTIGSAIGDAHAQLELAGGYDHNFVLNASTGGEPQFAAQLAETSSGRILDVLTTEPGVQFYSGNFLDGTIRGKGGRRYGHRAGLCLETQHFPDAPNHSHFPSVVLQPGEKYRSSTIYRFDVTTDRSM